MTSPNSTTTGHGVEIHWISPCLFEYREGDRILRVNRIFANGESAAASQTVFLNDLLRWDPPHVSEALTPTDIDRISESILEMFTSAGLPTIVDRNPVKSDESTGPNPSAGYIKFNAIASCVAFVISCFTYLILDRVFAITPPLILVILSLISIGFAPLTLMVGFVGVLLSPRYGPPAFFYGLLGVSLSSLTICILISVTRWAT